MTTAETHKAAKEAVMKKISHNIMRMQEHCKRQKLNNAMIARRAGLHTPMVWRFINQKSPEMTMINFFLIAEAIGYEITMKFPVESND